MSVGKTGHDSSTLNNVHTGSYSIVISSKEDTPHENQFIKMDMKNLNCFVKLIRLSPEYLEKHTRKYQPINM